MEDKFGFKKYITLHFQYRLNKDSEENYGINPREQDGIIIRKEYEDSYKRSTNDDEQLWLNPTELHFRNSKETKAPDDLGRYVRLYFDS